PAHGWTVVILFSWLVGTPVSKRGSHRRFRGTPTSGARPATSGRGVTLAAPESVPPPPVPHWGCPLLSGPRERAGATGTPPGSVHRPLADPGGDCCGDGQHARLAW